MLKKQYYYRIYSESEYLKEYLQDNGAFSTTKKLAIDSNSLYKVTKLVKLLLKDSCVVATQEGKWLVLRKDS